VDYDNDVQEDAVGFLEDHEDEFKEAIKDGTDFDINDISCLDTSFHESITDRAYSLTDAAYIIEHCENEETDSGLWEGQQPEDAISTKAAFSYSRDVWFKCEELYNSIKDRFEELQEEIHEGLDDKELVENKLDEDDSMIEKRAIKEAWDEFEDQYTKVRLIEPGSVEERQTLLRWLSFNERAGMFGGGPLGSSYIDSRCGTGHGMPEVKDFVDFDHDTAKRLPHFQGKTRDEIRMHCKMTEKTEGG
jgi:hypothetical protein